MRQVVAFFVVLITIFILAACSHTPPKNSMEAQAALGKEHFQMHCVGCHGPDGKGGTMITSDVQPADLTTIMTRRGVEEFPVMEIARMIDGRNRVEAHGTATMPIWGEVFTSGELLNEEQVEGKLEEIIAYLVSIQVKEY